MSPLGILPLFIPKGTFPQRMMKRLGSGEIYSRLCVTLEVKYG